MSKEAINRNSETPDAAQAPVELTDDRLDKVQGAARAAGGSKVAVSRHNQLWGDWF